MADAALAGMVLCRLAGGVGCNVAPTAVWPGDHIFCTQGGFHYSLTLTKRPGQWVPKWPGGGRGGQVAGSMADSFRQNGGVGKNTHFFRELDPFPPIHPAGGGGRAVRKS